MNPRITLFALLLTVACAGRTRPSAGFVVDESGGQMMSKEDDPVIIAFPWGVTP